MCDRKEFYYGQRRTDTRIVMKIARCGNIFLKSSGMMERNSPKLIFKSVTNLKISTKLKEIVDSSSYSFFVLERNLSS